MKKILLAASTVLVMLSSCNQKPTLAGSEFNNPNVMPAIADSTWNDFKANIDYQIDSIKQVIIPQLEEQAQRKFTAEELAGLDKELAEQMDEKYAEGRHEIDSLKNLVVLGFTMTFKDDEHMTMDVRLKADGQEDTDNYEGTYLLEGDKVILTYEGNKDTLLLSQDGKFLSGRFNGNTYSLSLEKTK